MSSKRIQKRLDQLFTDIKQAGSPETKQEGSTALKPRIDIRQVAQEQEIVRAKKSHVQEEKFTFRNQYPPFWLQKRKF